MMKHDGGWLNDYGVNLMVHICNFCAWYKAKKDSSELPTHIGVPSNVQYNFGSVPKEMEGDPQKYVGGPREKYSQFCHTCSDWYSHKPKGIFSTILDEYDRRKQKPEVLVMPYNIPVQMGGADTSRGVHCIHITSTLKSQSDGGCVESVDYLSSLNPKQTNTLVSDRMYMAKYFGMYIKEKEGDEEIFCGPDDMFMHPTLDMPTLDESKNVSLENGVNQDEKVGHLFSTL